MRVIRAKILGYCMGVRRAMDIALGLTVRGRSIYSYGPLIHNPQASRRLEDAGLLTLKDGCLSPNDLTRLSGATIIIRAHGASPAILSLLREAGAKIVDATCPRVLASQRKAADFARRGFFVILVGDRNHAEIKGIQGYAPGAHIVGDVAEATALPLDEGRSIGIIAQTTIKQEEFDSIKAEIVRRTSRFEIFESICPATVERQEALIAIAKRCDAILVIGGKDSANTARLLATARDCCKPSWHIESAADIPADIARYATIGLAAGASTPDSVIDEVEMALLSIR